MGRVSEYASIPAIVQPRVAPSGAKVAYFSDRSGRHELHITDTTGHTTRLTNGESPRNPFSPLLWHPDGTRIYLPVGGDDGEKDIVNAGVASLDGTVRTLYTSPGRTILWDVSPDGRYLWYFSRNEADEINFVRFDQETDTHDPLPLQRFVHRGGGVAPTGDRIAFNDNPHDQPHSEVYIAASDGADRRRLDINGDEQAFVLSWGPTGNRLLVTDRLAVSGSPSDGALGIHHLQKGRTEWVDGSEGPRLMATFLPGGDRIFSVEATTARVYDCRTDSWRELNVSGSVRLPPTAQDGAVCDGDVVILHRSSETNPGELLRYDLHADEAIPLVETLPATLSESTLFRATERTYQSESAGNARVLLYEPESTSPSPGVTIVEGSAENVSRGFDPLVQFLVAEGYVVCKPAIPATPYSEDEHADVAAVGRWLSTRDSVQHGHIAVYGHSHGGYNAYAQAVWHPEVWRAAIAYNGLTDLEALVTTEACPWKLRDALPSYEESPEAWRELSPITNAETLGVPLLMLHGTNDPIVPVSQARRFRAALDGADKEHYVYHELAGGHGGGTDRGQRASAWEYLLAFLDGHL